MDGRTNVRTDERTNGRKLARLCLPAKAGATTRTGIVPSLNVLQVKGNNDSAFKKLCFWSDQIKKESIFAN